MTPRDTERRIRLEFKRWSTQPRPRKEWELIWVITGFDTTLSGSGMQNDTKRRFEEGIRLAKKIATLRKGEMPKIYLSGYNEHNVNLKKYRAEGFFEKKYAFPSENILIGPHEHILHTLHQFEKFPKKFFAQFKKIIVVSDAYHLPRITRYADRFFHIEQGQFVFYPSQPIIPSARRVNEEVEKILAYAQKGDIPLFTKKEGVTKAVVTGATGFLGSHLVSELSKMPNVSVAAFDRARHNFTDKKSLQELLIGADVVFHLAARKSEPAFNTSSTRALLNAMRISAPDAVLLFASSFAVYRTPQKGESVNEAFALRPRSGYGKSKVACERMIRDFSRRYGLRAVIFRISNPYGPTPKLSHSIVDSVQRSFKANTPLRIDGDIEETRDFIFVSDVIAAFKKVLVRIRHMRGCHTYNICTGKETSLRSLLTMIEQITGRHIPLVVRTSAGHIPGFWKGGLQKAKRELQWRPTVGIRRGLRYVFPAK